MDLNHLEIRNCEARLISAIKNADHAALAALLHNDLKFVIPGGSVITKEMDLETYRSGEMAVDDIETTEQDLTVLGDCAVVTVLVSLRATYKGYLISGQFRYIRVWKSFDDVWQVIAGSSSAIDAPRSA